MITTTTDTDELAKIIRQLMFFIINEGKNYSDQSLRELYISKYLFLFAKIMNQVDDPNEPNIKQLIDIITKDIEKYNFT
ncbi:hypothetical protein [Aquimarina agarilytica]|uniref:hypothetical protein n=1 Tax=Aquimarina agarilytica TaxID=1087449 RepID=UPI000289E6CB|nr:hypothetical protein [Aquimarina agarilytica]